MLLFYNLLLTIFAPVWVPWMLFRTWRRKEQPNWKERSGNFDVEPRKDHKRIWVHAVSVGEVVASTPILREIRALLPDYEIILTTTTSSGHQTARDTAKGLYDKLFYFPIDVNRFQAAAMQRMQPAVIAVMETELWPNFLWWAKVFDTHTLLINGRISDRSFKRSKGLKAFYKMMLKNVDRCLMQTEADAARIKALGAQTAEVFGNAKFDQAAMGVEVDRDKWFKELQLTPAIPTLVIGSTRGEEEEKFVIDAIKKLNRNLNVIHAPRHIERVPELVKLLQSNGIDPTLRSQLSSLSASDPNTQHPVPNTVTPQHRNTDPSQLSALSSQYLLLDSYGELDQVYSVADIVIIGGGFGNFGGQNLIQPLAQGKPVLHGPHMQNFREITEQADKAGAAKMCETPDQLAQAISSLLDNLDEQIKMGGAAKSLVIMNVGASRRYAEAIVEEVAAFHLNA
jgi:3-deoxy-D-manno-octulosonic-acid transferase